jgi:hypothetical protein
MPPVNSCSLTCKRGCRPSTGCALAREGRLDIEPPKRPDGWPWLKSARDVALVALTTGDPEGDRR